MATIRERRNQNGTVTYHAQVRLKGHPPQTASFKRRTDARRWAARTESDIRDGRHFPGAAARRHTVADMTDRYAKTILPHKAQSTITNQTHQLAWWNARIGHLRLSDVTPEVLAAHANARGVDLAHWSFLTGPPGDVAAVVRSFGVGSTRNAQGEIEHLVVTFLIDQQGMIVKRYVGQSHGPDEIAKDLADLVL